MNYSHNTLTLSDDERTMCLALEQAQRAYAIGEVPVGAVIVDPQGKLVAQGYNRSIIDHDPSQHAEMMALRAACKTVGNYRLPGYSLFVTLEPCLMCLGALLHARLERVVFGAPDPKTGVCGSVLSLHEHTGLNHQTLLSGGVLESECANLLRQFFRERRTQQSLLKQQALFDANKVQS